MTRRGVLGALAALPVAAAAPIHARDYGGAAEVMETIDALSAVAVARLEAIVGVVPRAAVFAASAKADLARHGQERRALPPRAWREAAPPRLDDAVSLPRLREAVEALMHAHAEGLPALDDGASVQRLAEHMIDLSRLLTVVDLWMESEGLGE